MGCLIPNDIKPIEMDEQEKGYVAQIHKREEEWNMEIELLHLHYDQDLWGTKLRMDNIYKEMEHSIKLPLPKKKHLQKL